MRISRLFLLLLVGVAGLLSLTGCAVGPDYKRPVLNTPSDFGRLSKTHDTADRLLVRWWEDFGDSDIDWLVRKAVDQNHDLRVALARVFESRAHLSSSRSEFSPTLDARAAYSRNRESASNLPKYVDETLEFKPGVQNINEIGFDSRWEIDLWGRIRRLNEMSQAELRATENSRRDAMVTIIAEVVREYVRLRSVQEQRELAKDVVSVNLDFLSIYEARLKNGVICGADLAKAKADFHAAEAVLPVLDAQIEEVIHRLSVLIGRNPMDLDQRLTTIKPLPKPPGEIPTTLPSVVVRRRADIQTAEMELAAATARIGVATADLFPRFTLLGRVGWESTRLSSLFEARSLAYSFGPSVQWPIWDWGKIRANIRVQGAQHQAALARYEQGILIALEEVETSLSRVFGHKEQYKKLLLAHDASTETVRILSVRKSRGLESRLAILEAERSLLSSRKDLAECQAELVYDVIQLYKALGGGWEAFEDEKVAPTLSGAKNVHDAE